MGKDPRRRRLKSWTVTAVRANKPPETYCSETLLRESNHSSYDAALKAVYKAERDFKGIVGLRIDLNIPFEERPTAWDHILAV